MTRHHLVHITAHAPARFQDRGYNAHHMPTGIFHSACGALHQTGIGSAIHQCQATLSHEAAKSPGQVIIACLKPVRSGTKESDMFHVYLI